MPLSIDVRAVSVTEVDADLLAVAAFRAPEGSEAVVLSTGAAQVAEVVDVDLTGELAAVGFDGAVGALARIPTRGALSVPTVLVVGLGRADELDPERLRRAAAKVAGASSRSPRLAAALHGAAGAAGDGPGVEVGAAARAVAEGLWLGSYRFVDYRRDPTPQDLEAVLLLVDRSELDAVESALVVARVSAAATLLARDLVNTPPQDKRPPALADRVRDELEGTGVGVEILDEQALAEGGYGGLIGVGQGSSAPPRLVVLSYRPERQDAEHVVLVGKGITFDTGGISLKPSTAMETMKVDMAGAATVLAVVRAVAQLGLPVRVTGLLALAENMPSGTATRVSDVLTLKGGTTVEVINTDAEGRLVLGDALVHASELEPDAIVDVATLTGAAVVALGERIGVLMASDDGLADELLAASDVAAEPLWRLPLASEQYGDRLKGSIADLRNAGSRSAGTIFAGLFLHRFVGEGIPWAHLDIAGVAWTEESGALGPKGGTGVPVRTLIDWLVAR